MSEALPVDSCCSQACEKETPKFKKKRDIFRFKGANQDMAINLEHVFKIVQQGKRITFEPINADPEKPFTPYVEFETEEAAQKAQDQILSAWSSDVAE